MQFKPDQFEYLPSSRTYVAEASELGISAPQEYIGIDGYAFAFDKCDKDASGEDVMGWRFKPTGDSVSLNPALAGCGVLIIND
jgi:hypothetical protein